MSYIYKFCKDPDCYNKPFPGSDYCLKHSNNQTPISNTNTTPIDLTSNYKILYHHDISFFNHYVQINEKDPSKNPVRYVGINQIPLKLIPDIQYINQIDNPDMQHYYILNDYFIHFNSPNIYIYLKVD